MSSLLALQSKKAGPKITTKKVTTTAVKKSAPPPKPVRVEPISGPISDRLHPKPAVNGVSRSSTPRKSATPASSRHPSKEPIERLKQERKAVVKRSSPVATTPQFSSSDDEDVEQPRKRPRLDARDVIDPDRKIRDESVFQDSDIFEDLSMVHAADIANGTVVEHSRNKYEAFFTALGADESEEPIIELQYPGAYQRERYQLVKPTDLSDFRPIAELFENMKIVSTHYLSGSAAEKVYNEEEGDGLYQKLKRPFRDGELGRVGAQQRFIDIIDKYNDLVSSKRKDGTISSVINSMQTVNLKLVEHIIKTQIYSRTVSPQVHLVRQYEGFSDNVYGELLPMFLSRIFKETKLKSNQVFVDLGSGVGNCVLQAALETGCESWGCEMMENPSKLAQLQAQEFPARCKLWGLKPGAIRLIQDDFLQNTHIDEVLKRADVILINNQAFTAELNDKLKIRFLDLKEGAQIVSLKYFRDPAHRIKESNMENPINVLTVREMERFSGMVSWSDDPGKWYLHTKDSTELERFSRRFSEKKG